MKSGSPSKNSARASLQLNAPQQQAVDHGTGPVLVIAGAGTGKTTVLTQRIVRLIRDGHARPDEILALTYSNPAAAEMRKRVQQELGASAEGGKVQIRTFHDYGRRVLDRNGRTFRLIEEVDLRIYLRRRVRELNLKHFISPDDLGRLLGGLMEFIKRCQDELRTPDDYDQFVRDMEQGKVPLQRTARGNSDELTREETLERCREVAHVFRKVEEWLAEEGWGTFAHMISGCLHLLEQDAAALAAEQARARYILADEFQDANYAQVLLLKRLAGESRNIFAVGDPDQSIYKFRGASSEAFDMFRREFPETRVIHLDQNQRSRQPVLECAHLVIRSNPEVFAGEAAKLYQRKPLVSARDARQLGESGQEPRRVKVELVSCKSVQEEAREIAQAIQEQRRLERCAYRDFAVLYRSHGHRNELIAELERAKVPFEVSGQDICETAEVRDILAAAQAVASPVASASILRVAALPAFGLDGKELQAALASTREQTFAAVLEEVKGGRELLAALDRARDRVRKSPTATAALRATVDVLEIPIGPAGRSFLRFAWEWQRKPLAGEGKLNEFLHYMDDFADAGGEITLDRMDGEVDVGDDLPERPEADAVQLMTAHRSKGLEFPHVFIIRAASNGFPSSYREPAVEFPAILSREESLKSRDAKELHAEEERRLFYVAMTRARDTLHIYAKPMGKSMVAARYPADLHEADRKGEWHMLRTVKPQQQTLFQAGDEAAKRPRLHEWFDLPAFRASDKRLSASAIDRYERCGLRFKLDRDWKLPTEPSASLQYGASMHRALQHYYQSVQAGRPVALPDLLEFFRENLRSAGLAEDYQRKLLEDRGCRDLEAFVAAAELQSPPEVLRLEAEFNFQLEDVTIIGRLDRVDQLPDGRVRIVDYKTGKPKTQEIAEKSVQLPLYAMAAQAMWQYDVAESLFYYLQNGTQLPVRCTDAVLLEAKGRVREVAEGIEKGRFEPTTKKETCSYCDFYSLCPTTERRVYGLVQIEAIPEDYADLWPEYQ